MPPVPRLNGGEVRVRKKPEADDPISPPGVSFNKDPPRMMAGSTKVVSGDLGLRSGLFFLAAVAASTSCASGYHTARHAK